MESGGDLPKDDRSRAEKQIQDLTDAHTKKLDEMSAQKEKEVLEV
jgi:ribosome recycling factor